jgi:hypothetical protein
MTQIMKSNRRLFLKQSSLVIASCSIKTNYGIPVSTPFVHHVLFWLKDKSDTENYNNVLKSLQEFRKIKQVKFLHVGAPSISDIDYEARATDTTYTFSYLALFESKTENENYLANPLHTKFFNDFEDVMLKVIIYDSLNIKD